MLTKGSRHLNRRLLYQDLLGDMHHLDAMIGKKNVSGMNITKEQKIAEDVNNHIMDDEEHKVWEPATARIGRTAAGKRKMIGRERQDMMIDMLYHRRHHPHRDPIIRIHRVVVGRILRSLLRGEPMIRARADITPTSSSNGGAATSAADLTYVVLRQVRGGACLA